GNPYVIKTATQLNNINYYYIEDFFFELANNINLNGAIMSIGSKQKPFAGVLDGNNCTISDLSLNGTNEGVGLFAYTSGATIKNLILSNANATISRNDTTYAGLLVGLADNTSLENILVSGSIIQGGTGNTSATFCIGGVVGKATGESTSIIRVRNFANVTFTTRDTSLITYAGGIIGWYEASEGDNSGIINCGNEGNVSGTIVGGLVGYAICPISNSYNIGTITAYTASSSDANAGGLIGKTSSTIYNIIQNVYNVGDVVANASASRNCYAGGLIGYGVGDIINFYNNGNIITSKPNTTATTAGWIVGYNVKNSITVDNCYNTNSAVAAPSGSGALESGYETVSASELNNAVETYLGKAFVYSSAKNRVVLVIESTLLG
ncbi:MAG: hypothetical protein ACI4TX_02270, partial [Christensenellales bacterium]